MKKLLLLRAAAFILLIVILIRPVMVRPDPNLSKKWAVLLDTSRSMQIKDPQARIDKEKELAHSVLDSLPNAELYEFGDGLKELSKEKIDSLEAAGQKTNMASAIQEVFSKSDLRGAVILTDGRQVGIGDPVSAAAVAGKPLLLVGIGSKSAFKDVAVKNIQAPPFAFKNIQTGLTATISALGYTGQSLTVKLLEGGKVLSLQTINVSRPEFEAAVTFNWTPSVLGSQLLRVEVSPVAGEVTTVNNKKEVSLEVGRDKFRVLYICGKPGPEYGFLRYQFKSDPAVELVTFVILRNASNVVSVGENELSLIPFPTQEVLISQMSTFDLVVFEEFSFWQVGLQPTLLQAIRRKVENGGSFLLVGGEEIFQANSFFAAPGFQEMIPVSFSNEIKNLSTPVQFVPVTKSHPILRIDPNEKKNDDLWNSLPPLENVALVPSVKPGATVVGAVMAGGKSYPVLSVWKFGRGRVGALTARTTWRWSLVPGKKEQSPYLYQQFWKNMVLWLTRADEYKPVRISVEARPVRLADPVPVRVWVYDEYFKPLVDSEVKIQIDGPDNFTVSPNLSMEAPGVFQGTFLSEKLGSHTARVWVTRQGKKYGDDAVGFRVVESQIEEEDVSPDFDLLRELSEVSGGKFISADEFSADLFAEFDNEMTEKAGRKVLIWNSPWLFAAVFGLLALEWFLRKRRGLP